MRQGRQVKSLVISALMNSTRPLTRSNTQVQWVMKMSPSIIIDFIEYHHHRFGYPNIIRKTTTKDQRDGNIMDAKKFWSNKESTRKLLRPKK